MNKNTNYIAETAITIWAFAKSPVLAFFLLMYFIYINEENKKEVAKAKIPKKDATATLTTEDINRISETERKRAMTEDGLEDVLVTSTASSFDFYQEFLIDNYDNKFYRVMAPNGTYLEKIFTSLEEAKAEVDAARVVMPVQKPKRKEIYDIRFVK